jgi:hypothetical protein
MSSRHSRLVAFLTLISPLVVGACSSRTQGSSGDEQAAAPVPVPECEAYTRELRACLANIGAPQAAVAQLEETLRASDDAARTRMNASCAIDRARLAEGCK